MKRPFFCIPVNLPGILAMSKHIGFGAFWLVALVLTVVATGREWKDATGSFNVQGDFLSLKQGVVYIEKADGKIIKVPLEKLSPADQSFVKEQTGEKESPSANGSNGDAEKPASKPSGGTSTNSGRPTGGQNILKLTVPDQDATGEVRRFADMGWGVCSFAFSPDGRYLAAGKSDDAVMVFDVERGKRIDFHDKLNTSGQIKAVRFSPDGSRFVSGGYRGRCTAWNVEKGHLDSHKQFGGHTGEITALAFSPDSQMVFSGGEDKKACYWNFDTAAEMYSFEGFKNAVRAVWIAPTGKLAIASDGSVAQLIDLTNGKVKGTMPLYQHSVHAVAISPDGKLISVSEGYKIMQWETKSGGERAILKDNNVQWTCEYSPNSKYLVSGASQLNLYAVESGKRVSVFDIKQHTYIQALAFSPDGRHVATIPSSAGQDIVIIRLPKLE